METNQDPEAQSPEIEVIADNEAVYDEKIAPLMTEIIKICKEHRMPILANFEYAPGKFCSTYVPQKGENTRFQLAASILRDGYCAFATVKAQS